MFRITESRTAISKNMYHGTVSAVPFFDCKWGCPRQQHLKKYTSGEAAYCGVKGAARSLAGGVRGVRVSGGHLCEAEAPTEPTGETQSPPKKQ